MTQAQDDSTMLFGARDDFAIECSRHDLPLSEEQRSHGWVFGYLCVWVAGQRLGDINDWNMLDPVEAHFQDLTDEQLGLLTDEAVDHLANDEAFRLLNAALYQDDARTDEQICADARRFKKFDFLVNWGEMFDHPPVKAFLLKSDAASLRVLYQIGSDPIASATVSVHSFKEAVGGFLRSMNEMRTARMGSRRRPSQ